MHLLHIVKLNSDSEVQLFRGARPSLCTMLIFILAGDITRAVEQCWCGARLTSACLCHTW